LNAHVASKRRGLQALDRGVQPQGRRRAARHLDFSEIHDVGNRVVAVGRLTIRGRASGVPTESPFGWLGEFSNGKATRIRTYLSPDEALEIAGLHPGGR
jgi:ketosteroid isomerase-like protein